MVTDSNTRLDSIGQVVDSMREMALRLESKAAHVLRGDGSLAITAGMLREAADIISTLPMKAAEVRALEEALAPFVDLRCQPERFKVVSSRLKDMAPVTVTVTKAQMNDAARLIYRPTPTPEPHHG